MHCPECGQEILAGSAFCGNCGAPVTRQQAGPVCANCGSPNQPGAEFCAECGARLGGEVMPMQSFCPECGAAVKEGAAFCKECGADLNATTAPAPFVCPECGEPLPPDAAFCGNCGQVLQQGAEYAPAPATTATEYQPSYPPERQDYSPQQDWVQPQEQPQAQDWEYSQQQEQGWEPQPQAQPQQQNLASQLQVKTQPQKSGMRKMLMAAAAAVVLLVIGITGFWKPGYLLDLFRPTAKLENGVLALKDITLDFKQTNLSNGAATMTTVKDKESEEQNGLIGDLYVMKIDKSCQGKVTVAIPVPKEYKPGNNDGQHIKLGIGREYPMVDGKTTRRYSYFDAEVKDGKAVAVIDPAAVAQSTIRNKATEKSAETTPDLGEYTEYVGYYFKYEFMPQYGEGYKYSKGHFRLWYNYYTLTARNHYMGGDDAQKLLSDLEEAYNYYKKNGFADYVDAFTPIDVYIEDIKDEGGWLSSTGEIQLREKSLFGANRNMSYDDEARRPNVRKTIYHEFFHAVQQGIINGAASYFTKTLWFDEATATHFERVVYPDAVPENGQSFSRFMWGGVIPENNTAEDGYGRVLLIDYISSKMGGDAWIKDCYENWTADCRRLKSYIRKIALTEGIFAADFYREVMTKIGHIRLPLYYKACLRPDVVTGEDRYLGAIKIQLDDKTKEKIANGEEDAFPIVFTSKPFELGAYGGYVIALAVPQKQNSQNQKENIADDLPEKCQLKLEAEGDCRIQVIRYKTVNYKNAVSSYDNIIKDFKKQTEDNYVFLVLVTSTQNKKQNVVLKATLEKEDLKEGIYTGKAKVTMGKKTVTVNNRVFFRLSRLNDGRWGLVVCEANGDYNGTSTIAPLTYDAKKKVYNGHRKFKQDVSSDPKIKKMTTGEVNCTMKVNLEEKEPVLIIDYDSKWTTWKWGFPTKEGVITHFEGKWVSELKGRNLQAGKEDKVIIVE